MKTVVAFDTFETPRLINLWPARQAQPASQPARNSDEKHASRRRRRRRRDA